MAVRASNRGRLVQAMQGRNVIQMGGVRAPGVRGMRPVPALRRTPRGGMMAALDDRKRWLDHLAECTLCPVNLCDKGEELAAAVRQSMAPGETWEWA